jgi:matrixin/S-layer family protein
MKIFTWKPALQALTLVLSVLLFSSMGSATTVVMLRDQQLIKSSRVILLGDVQSVKAQWDRDHENIYTYVKVRVSRLLKGKLQNEEIVFKQLGGAVGDDATVIFGAPEYKAGDRLLLFLSTAADGTLRIAHLFMGKYDVVTNQKTGTSRVERKFDKQSVYVLGQQEGPDITNSTTLNRFIKKIKNVLAESETVAAQDATEEDRPIVETPPEYVEETGDITPNYTFLGSGFRWFEPDTLQPVSYRVNSTGAPVAGGGVGEINQGLAGWTNVQTTALVLQNAGSTTAQGFRADGVTAISFNDPLDQMQDPVGCSGVLAIGGVSSGGGGTIVIGGRSFTRIREGDVVFNRNFQCFLGVPVNLAEVACHEIGHSIGFDHSADPAATMAPSAHGNGRGATLGADDIAGVSFLYPGSKAATQRFTDVPPSHVYFAQIEKIAARGITVGCTTTTYCPNGLVTREEMAVFIERALGVFNPPTPTFQKFIDVPPSRFGYAFIADFSTRGITAGCTTNRYCPDVTVSREQIATLLEKAVGRTNPPTPAFQRFVDLGPASWSYPFVESFVQNGLSRGVMDIIKRGCNADGLHYCPFQPINRGEMAALLVLAFNL